MEYIRVGVDVCVFVCESLKKITKAILFLKGTISNVFPILIHICKCAAWGK